MSEYFTIKPINNEYIITATRISKKYIFFGAEIITKRQYRGDCTVWDTYPDGFSCPALLQAELHRVWKIQQWSNNE